MLTKTILYQNENWKREREGKLFLFSGSGPSRWLPVLDHALMSTISGIVPIFLGPFLGISRKRRRRTQSIYSRVVVRNNQRWKGRLRLRARFNWTSTAIALQESKINFRPRIIQAQNTRRWRRQSTEKSDLSGAGGRVSWRSIIDSSAREFMERRGQEILKVGGGGVGTMERSQSDIFPDFFHGSSGVGRFCKKMRSCCGDGIGRGGWEMRGTRTCGFGWRASEPVGVIIAVFIGWYPHGLDSETVNERVRFEIWEGQGPVGKLLGGTQPRAYIHYQFYFIFYFLFFGQIKN